MSSAHVRMTRRAALRLFGGVGLGLTGASLFAACGPASTPAAGGGPAPAPTTTARVAQAGTTAELVVTSYGGSFEQQWRKNVVEPFEQQFNARVNVLTSLTLATLAKLRAEKDNPQIDVATMDTVGAAPAASEGLFEKLDRTRVPNIAHLHDWAVEKDGNYVSFFTGYDGLAFNTEKVKNPPASYEDLWRPEYKGRVLFPDISTAAGVYELAVLAKMTGGDVDTNDVDGAFKKLGTLKPNLLTFATSMDQVGQLLTQGEAWIAPWAGNRALQARANNAPLGINTAKEGFTFVTSEMGIVAGTKQKDLAAKYINFCIDATTQKKNADTMYVGPTNKTVELSPDQAKDLASTPEQQAQKITLDWVKISAYRDQWTERWNREIK